MDALSVIKFNVVNLAFKTRASSIHLNKFAPGYPQKKIFISVSYKVFHRKERDILSLLISLRKASLLFTALSKKAFKFFASVV